jgi:hypothetical protein
MGEGGIRDPGDYVGRHRPAPGRWDASLVITFPQRYVLGFDASAESHTMVICDAWRDHYSLTQSGWAEALRLPPEAQRAIHMETPMSGLAES